MAGQAAKEGDGARRRPLWAGALIRARARAGASYRCAGGRGGAGCLPGGVDGAAGQEPGAGLAGDAVAVEREGVAARAGRGALAEDGNRAAGRREHPGGQAQQGGLARAVGADEPDHVTFGDGQRAVAQRPGPPVLLAQSAGRDEGVHATPSAKQSRKAVR